MKKINQTCLDSDQKLKILQIAPFAFTIGTSARYGGIERVVNDLDKEFSKQGHESYVVATKDSKITGNLLPVFDKGLWVLEKNKEEGWKYKKDEFDYDEKREEHARKVIEYVKQVKPDIIHDHIGFIKTNAFLDSKELPPILYTLHDPTDDPRSKEKLNNIKNLKKEIFFNAISYSQKGFFDDFITVDYMVYNALNLDDFEYSAKGEGFAFHLGLLNKPKGTDIALKAAKQIGQKIILAGPILTGRIHEPNNIGIAGNLWENEIKPNLDLIVEEEIFPEKVEGFVKTFMNSKYQSAYVGELNDAQKKEFYKRADAFYFPIRRQEPFGLVMIEAMASGTPVIAYDNGAVREIVPQGKAGFVINTDEIAKESIDDFVEGAAKVKNLSREECRSHVEEKFSVERQVRDYLGVYRDMLHDSKEVEKS